MTPRGWRAGGTLIAIALWIGALGCETASPVESERPAASAATATATPKPDFDAGAILQAFPPGVARNDVRLQGQEGGRFKARTSIKLHAVTDNDVNPVNAAVAQGTCSDCQTIAIAVQVALYQRGAPSVRPENVALAANMGCTRCVTVARAIQYVIPVDDPNEAPAEIKDLLRDIDTEARFLASINSVDQLSSDEVLRRLQSVLDKYVTLRPYLQDAMQKATAEN